MAYAFLNVGAGGGVLTQGGDLGFEVNHESTGTYRVTWPELPVVPAVVVAQTQGWTRLSWVLPAT